MYHNSFLYSFFYEKNSNGTLRTQWFVECIFYEGSFINKPVDTEFHPRGPPQTRKTEINTPSGNRELRTNGTIGQDFGIVPANKLIRC